MAFNVRQMPADRAAALIGEDDVAVFSQRLETMAATSQFDLEEPDSTRLTFLFEVGKDDLLREGNWLDGVDYMSDLVFETPRDLAGKIFKRFETFADDDHTPSDAMPRSRLPRAGASRSGRRVGAGGPWGYGIRDNANPTMKARHRWRAAPARRFRQKDSSPFSP